MDLITANMATIPQRLEVAAEAINSILPQVNRFNVMLNGYSMADGGKLFMKLNKRYLNKIFFEYLDNSMTDAAKYYRVENQKGYIFTCDDDIFYSPGYVDYMISKIEQYEMKAVISLHGRVWGDIPIASFYRDRKEGINVPGGGAFQCLNTVKGDHLVNGHGVYGCAGDGVMAWHSDTIKMTFDYCLLPNMSQLWMALKCNEEDVPQYAVEHEEGFVRQLWEGTGIWDDQVYNDHEQTKLVNDRWIKR
jgi:hypothetical protein